jgi:plastocyanin
MRPRHLMLVAALALLCAAASAASQIIRQKGRAFSVAEMTVQRGEPVDFQNDDTVPHNIMSTTPGNAFDLGTQIPGNSTPVIFSQAGIVAVICAIHPHMHMTITVTN